MGEFKILCEISKGTFEISHKSLDPYTAKYTLYCLIFFVCDFPGQGYPPIDVRTCLEVRTDLDPGMVSQIPLTFIDILMGLFQNIILIG